MARPLLRLTWVCVLLGLVLQCRGRYWELHLHDGQRGEVHRMQRRSQRQVRDTKRRPRRSARDGVHPVLRRHRVQGGGGLRYVRTGRQQHDGYMQDVPGGGLSK